MSAKIASPTKKSSATANANAESGALRLLKAMGFSAVQVSPGVVALTTCVAKR